MHKSLLVIVGAVLAAVVGYVVYMSYFAVEATIGKDAGIISNESTNQLPEVPKTEEQKLNVLDDLTSSADAPANTASEDAKEKILNSAAGSPKSDTIPAGDAEKIKLLESLKN